MSSPRRTRSTAVLVCLLVLVAFPLAPRPSVTWRPAGSGSATGSRLERARAQVVLDHHARLPLYFEANQGQHDGRVRFLARGRGYRVFLTETDAVVAVGRPGRGAVVRIRAEGGNLSRPYGEEPLSAKVHHFIGRDPTRWRANIPTFTRVRYRNIYPGIDLVYYGRQGVLEYDLVVAPGADPGRIAFAFDGADRIEMAADGDVVLHAAGGAIHLRRPVVYQEVDGVRKPIAGDYAPRGSARVGFQIGAYDRRRPLIIDPTLGYSTFLGGDAGGDIAYDIVVDGSGSAYVTGRPGSSDFPTTVGAYDTTFSSTSDVFVTKFNPAGSALVYSTFLGGSGAERGWGIAVDASGSAYVTGETDSSDFPTTAGAFDTTFNGSPGGNYDAFVTKLNASGSALAYSTYLGGSQTDVGRAVAVDGTTAAYVTGNTFSANFPVTPGAFDTSCTCSPVADDAFVAKLNTTGTALVYSTFLDGTLSDQGFGIAVDAMAFAYVTGGTASANFPVTPGAFDTSHGGLTDVFVTKLNAGGSALLFSTFLGGGSSDIGWAIAIDASGSTYVTGLTTGADFPATAGAFDPSYNGYMDAFVTKLNSGGSALLYSTFLGGTGHEQGFGIAVDAATRAHVTGVTLSTNFPTTPDAFDSTCGTDCGDVFFTTVNSTGSALSYSTYLGGGGGEGATAAAISPRGDVYITGVTNSPTFPTTPGAFDTMPGALDPSCSFCTDAFVTKFSFKGTDTPGLRSPSASIFFLRNANSAGPADVTFGYGPPAPAWIALKGDWDGDGDDTVGLYDPATGMFFLRNSNAPGPADITFGYGPGAVGFTPLAGDWDGDGDDTVGVYNPATGTFFLRSSNTPGPADMTFVYGPGGMGWMPIAGDWNADGIDTVGLYNPSASAFFLRNTNGAGPADLTFAYGPAGAGWTPLAGDWDGSGTDTAGLYNPSASMFFLRNTNGAGPADLTFAYGPAGAG